MEKKDLQIPKTVLTLMGGRGKIMYMSIPNVTPAQTMEMQEIITKLKAKGSAELVECLLENEGDCYTKKGRLNKSATTRKLGWKSKQLEDALRTMREILSEEFDIPD